MESCRKMSAEDYLTTYNAMQSVKNELYHFDKCANPLLPGSDIYPKLQGLKCKSRYERENVIGLDCDEVFPNIILGDRGTAKDLEYLKILGVTHVLNCAEGTKYPKYPKYRQVDTNASYYKSSNIIYKGLPIDDTPSYDIHRLFNECVEFTHQAIIQRKGKILIHCYMGISRSATVVIAYLVAKCGMSAPQALKQVMERRKYVKPNDGFLKQLCRFESEIRAHEQNNNDNNKT